MNWSCDNCGEPVTQPNSGLLRRHLCADCKRHDNSAAASYERFGGRPVQRLTLAEARVVEIYR